MAQAMRNLPAQDADAVYIIEKINAADQLDNEARSSELSAADKRKLATERRIEAGRRLIEVREKLSQKGNVPDNEMSGTFGKWLEENSISRTTSHNLMRLAGDTPEQRQERKAKDAERKREERQAKAKTELGWVTVLKDALGKIPGCKNKKAEYEEKMGESIPAYLKTKEDAEAFVERFVRLVGLPPDAEREQLPKSAEERLQRAVRIEVAKLQQSFHEQLKAKVNEAVAERVAHLESLEAKTLEATKRYQVMANGIKPIITKDDYRFLLNTLHSDRVPTPEKMDKAFHIVKKLEPYIEALPA